MIHIVFGEPDVDVLKEAIKLAESLQGEVIIIRDDLMVGPVENIYETEGYQHRRDWWKSLVDLSPYKTEDQMNLVDDKLTLHNLKRRLDEHANEEVWIWMGQNAHDVCGYYWLIGQLKEYVGRIMILYMNNLPFINEKGQIFYPTYLQQILPKEFLKAKKLSRKVTVSEMEIDPDEWRRLMAENGGVRILEGGKKIVSKEIDYFDEDILKNLTAEPQKGNRAIYNILGKMKVKTGDVFLLWRMTVLAAEGKIEISGDPAKGWKDFDVKLKSAASEAISMIEE